MEKLIQILKQIIPNADFENNKNLVEDGILDSFDIVSLVGQINEEFDIEIGAEDILPENFSSVEDIFKLIVHIQEAG